MTRLLRLSLALAGLVFLGTRPPYFAYNARSRPDPYLDMGELCFYIYPGYAPKSGIKRKEASALACLYVLGKELLGKVGFKKRPGHALHLDTFQFVC